jgi:hypothetical protein
MPVTQNMVSKVLTMAARTFPDSVVSLSLSYKDDAGTQRTWSGSGTAVPLTGNAKFQPDGTWISDGYRVILLIADLDPRWPRQTDLMDLRLGDAAVTTYQVRDAQPDATRTMLNLTLEKRFAT